MMDNSGNHDGQDAHENKEQEIYNYNMRRNCKHKCIITLCSSVVIL